MTKFARCAVALVVAVTLALPAGAALAERFSPRVLIVATSHAEAGESGKKTGLWLSELVEPYWVFRDRGIDVDIATIRGGPAPIDPRSGDEARLSSDFRYGEASLSKFTEADALAQHAADAYDAIFLAGGHGTMWDFPDDPHLLQMLTDAARDGRIIAAVCHGPAGLLALADDEGRSIATGRRLTAFTDREEAAAEWADIAPFSLEQRLRALGAEFVAASPFQANAVRDGNLITGQNPASSKAVAELVIAALAERASVANR